MGEHTAGGRARVTWRARPVVAPAESATCVRRGARSDPPPPRPASVPFLADVIRGLSRAPKAIPAHCMFDEVGARLFACLGALDEHPRERAELALLGAHAAEIARALGERVTLLDPACADGARAAQLAQHLSRPLEIVLADRVPGGADRAAQDVRARAPLAPLLALDQTDPWAIAPPRRGGRTVIYLGGAIAGELPPDALCERLRDLRLRAGAAPGLLVGLDLEARAAELEAAYDDRAGVAASFNMNVLARINRELRGTFQLSAFEHRAAYDAERSRVVLQLVSKRAQWASIGAEWCTFAAGEPIVTMVAHQWALPRFAAVAADAGWQTERVFVHPERAYALALLGG